MKKLLSLIMSVVLFLPFVSCKKDLGEHSATRIMLDTVVTISVYAENDDILNGAFELIEHYEQLFSRTIDSSDVSRINRAEGSAVEVDIETAEVIKTAILINEESGGAFDFTVTPLTELWNVNEASTPPKAEDITALLPLVGTAITVDGNSVTAPKGTKIDLGGIAKGYIADRIKEFFVENNITRGTINLGGNVMLIGDNGGEPYNVGIQKPFASTGEPALTLKLSDKTAVTSGIYERYFEYDGKVYHHIIDPKTGYPVDNDIASVTVICGSSMIADGLSTACLVLGFQDGVRLAESHDAQTVFIMKDGTIKVSGGLKVDQSGDLPCINFK